MICETLPPLPHAVDNMSATLLGDTLYVLGGNRNGIPSSSMFSLCLDNYSAGWTEVPFPGRPRAQPVCSSLLGKLYVSGGLPPEGMRLFQQMDYVTILNLDNGRWLRHLSPQKVNLSH